MHLPILDLHIGDADDKLLACEISDLRHELTFLQHLMRLHGWEHDFALRAVMEYKKFTFLGSRHYRQLSGDV